MKILDDVILASNSARRRELLKFVIEDYRVVTSNLDEKIIEKEILNEKFENNIEKYSTVCDTLAYEKCRAVSEDNKNSFVIAADTIVYDENKLFGKPVDEENAIYMLEYLSGRKHIVQTSVCIFHKEKYYKFCEKSYVTFNDLDLIQKNLIRDYVKNEKPFDKAGSYGIQDKGILLIKEFSGDFFNIVGLPISKLNREIYKILN